MIVNETLIDLTNRRLNEKISLEFCPKQIQLNENYSTISFNAFANAFDKSVIDEIEKSKLIVGGNFIAENIKLAKRAHFLET